MYFTLEEKTKILRLTLEYKTDKEIAKQMSNKKITGTKLSYSRTYNQLPKRKSVLAFIYINFIKRFANYLLEVGEDNIHADKLVEELNFNGIRNATNKIWDVGSLKRYLEKKGIRSRNGIYQVSSLSSLDTIYLEDIAEFDESLDPESFIPNLGFNLDRVPNVIKEVSKPLTQRKKKIKKAIEESLANGATTVAEITAHLNNLGFKNKAGNPLGRWSVKLLMQSLGLNCHIKQDARDYADLMRDWVLTHSEDEEITREAFMEKIDTYLYDGILFKNKDLLYSQLCDLIGKHNMAYRERMRGEEYRERVEFAVYQQYRHRPITAEEIGEVLGLSPMQGNRVMRDYLGIEPFDIWYKNLYKLVKEYVKEHEKVRICDLTEYLESSYLSTQRGCSWDQAITNLTYQRLRERYPDLPKSVGRRTIGRRKGGRK